MRRTAHAHDRGAVSSGVWCTALRRRPHRTHQPVSVAEGVSGADAPGSVGTHPHTALRRPRRRLCQYSAPRGSDRNNRGDLPESPAVLSGAAAPDRPEGRYSVCAERPWARGMWPTTAETTTPLRAVGCATEFEVRTHTPPWRYSKPTSPVGGRTGAAHNHTVWCDERGASPSWEAVRRRALSVSNAATLPASLPHD